MNEINLQPLLCVGLLLSQQVPLGCGDVQPRLHLSHLPLPGHQLSSDFLRGNPEFKTRTKINQ